MATKSELAEAAADVKARERALKEETAITLPQTEGTMAVALLSDDDFETRLDLLKKGRERIARVQREYMDEGVDYGLIPNTPKPTLFKPGAEKLAQLYGLTARIESQFIGGDNAQAPPLTYDSQCFLHVTNFAGPIVGIGHGTANSWEKRYRRAAAKVCPNCGKPALIKSKPEYGGGWYCFPKKDGCGSKFKDDDEAITGQEATDATGDAASQWDLGVTLMKMAEKRAFVDAVLRATATSGLFTQDVAEEAPEAVATPLASPSPSAAQRPAPDPTVTYRDAPPARVPQTVEATHDQTVVADADLMGRVLDVTGGEEIVVTQSDVEGVERGGRTQNANDAQIEELRRQARNLHWGAKRILRHANEILGTDMAIPDDANEAKAELESWLESLSAAGIGKLISEMRRRLEDDLPA